jgi:hypothetical protein
MLTGLLLGAGASVDFGMPLVWELTDSLKSWLTPENYLGIEQASRRRGGGYGDEVTKEVLSLLERKEMHFEALLGYFQIRQGRSGSDRKSIQTYASLYSWFSRIVSELIFGHHQAHKSSCRRFDSAPSHILLTGSSLQKTVFRKNREL